MQGVLREKNCMAAAIEHRYMTRLHYKLENVKAGSGN